MLTLRKVDDSESAVQWKIEGKWYPTRPLQYNSFTSRIKDAWLVLIGKADALIWPGGQ